MLTLIEHVLSGLREYICCDASANPAKGLVYFAPSYTLKWWAQLQARLFWLCGCLALFGRRIPPTVSSGATLADSAAGI